MRPGTPHLAMKREVHGIGAKRHRWKGKGKKSPSKPRVLKQERKARKPGKGTGLINIWQASHKKHGRDSVEKNPNRQEEGKKLLGEGQVWEKGL